MRKQLILAVLLVAGCGGVTSQDGESDDPLFTHPAPNNCHIFNPGYISLDGFDAGPRGTVGGINYEILGEPLWLRVFATAHQTYSGSGPTTFSHPVTIDGATDSVWLRYAYGLNLLQNDTWIFRAPVTSPSLVEHTVSLTSACGTETRTMIATPVQGVAPVPTLSVSATYVYPGTAVNLHGSSAPFAYNTCVNARAHLVGKQDYDGKVLLDETYEPNSLLIWDKTVKPVHDTTYTITSTCLYASNVTPQTVKAHVQVYEGNTAICGGAQPGTWQFCQSCPSSIFGSWNTTLIETACSYTEAKNGAQSMGTNCSLTDGPCS